MSRNFGRSLQAFFGVQNLLDKEYFVQTNPSTIGTPRLINGGVRVRFTGRLNERNRETADTGLRQSRLRELCILCGFSST